MNSSNFNPNLLTLEQLRYFLSAARTGNFTKAAEESALSQSAFSRQIQGLETSLGVTLFDRIGRQVHLNASGVALESRAAEILSRVDRLPAELSPAGQGLKGTIRLGSFMSYGVRMLPSWIAEFSQSFPDIRITLLLRTVQEMTSMLHKEAIDAAIMDAKIKGNNKLPSYLKAHLSYNEEMWVVGPKGLDPKKLPGPDARWFGIYDAARLAQLAKFGIVVTDPTRVPGGEVALKFIEAGLGYSVLPKFMAGDSWQAGRITRFSASIKRRVGLVSLASGPRSPCVSQLIEFLRPRWKRDIMDGK